MTTTTETTTTEKRNYEWPLATVWDGFSTQDKAGGSTQKFGQDLVANTLISRGFKTNTYEVSVLDPRFNADYTGVIDATSAIQAAIDYAASLNKSNVIVRLSAGLFKLSSAGTVQNPAFDNGSGTANAYNGSTTTNITAETPSTQNYCLKIPAGSGIRLIGDGIEATKLVGPYSSGVSIAYPAAVVIDGHGGSDLAGTTQWTYGCVENVSFENFFMGIYAPEAFIVESHFENLIFKNCAFPILTRLLERVLFKRIHFKSCSTGIISGGFWTTRCDNYTDFGGWGDKVIFDEITTQNMTPYSSSQFAAVDTFFDTYYFKTENNTTRKYPSGGSGTPATARPYYGVAGRMLCTFSRYFRPNQGNSIGAIRHMYSSRPPFDFGQVSSLSIDSIYIEGCGYVNGTNSGNIVGDGANNDPYITGRYPNIISASFGCTGSIQINSMDLQHFGAVCGAPKNNDWGNLIFPPPSIGFENETVPHAAWAKRSATFEDYGTEKVLGTKVWKADQSVVGYRFGTQVHAAYVATAAGHSIASIQLPAEKYGTYMVHVWGSPNGGVENRMSGVFVITWVPSDSYPAWSQLQTIQIGTNCSAAGAPIKPTGLTVGTPSTAGIFTADFATSQVQVYIVAFVSRIA